MAGADLILKTRTAHAGGIVEMVVWRVPQSVPPSEHPFKYRLVFARGGQRVVGYDNERGKGDHKHISDREAAYEFVSVDTLINDFLSDVEAFS